MFGEEDARLRALEEEQEEHETGRRHLEESKGQEEQQRATNFPPRDEQPRRTSTNPVEDDDLIRKRRYVKAIEVLAFLAWALTMGSGCYGFWLGFDTKAVGPKHSDLDLCQVSGDTCSLTKDHQKICEACHRERFDASLIVTSFYMALFGFLNIISYCANVYSNFGFLRSRMGRGFTLFFLGNLTIAQGVNFLYTESFTMATGVVDTVVGAAQMLSYCWVSSGHMQPVPRHSDYQRMER